MALKLFDSKFGEDFLKSLPLSPGIYRVFDKSGELIYVGKAKNLRRRLSQYRNVKRRKAHRKMKAVVQSAAQIEIEACDTDAEAQRLELKLIQSLRPRLNVAGAFHFMYPLVGLRRDKNALMLLITSSPDKFADYSFHGCFRSRLLSRRAFRAIGRLLYFFGEVKNVPVDRKLYSTLLKVSQLHPDWAGRLEAFLEGRSKEFLSELCLAMLEKSGALQRREQVQEDLELLEEFWKLEVLRLKELRQQSGFVPYPVPQAERDMLLLNARLARAEAAGHA